MFKEQTFPSWTANQFFSGCQRMQKSKTNFPPSLFRVDLSMHYASRFSSYVNACINLKTLLLQKIIGHASKPRKSTFLFLEGVKVCFFWWQGGSALQKEVAGFIKSCFGRYGVMDDCHTCGRCGRDASCFAISELFVFKLAFSRKQISQDQTQLVDWMHTPFRDE